MHGVMKVKGVNVGETKIGSILDEINPEAQRKRQNISGHLLNPEVYNAKYSHDKIHYDQNKKLELLICVLEMDFRAKQLGMLLIVMFLDS